MNELEEFGTAIEEHNEDNYADAIVEKSQTPQGRSSVANEAIQTGLCQWSYAYEGAFWAVSKTFVKLEAGAYSLGYKDGRPCFVKETIKIDELLEFPDSVSDRVVSEIQDFWGKKQRFTEFGFLHRRGYLFFGPAGSGKSCIIQQLMSKLIKNGGIVLYCNCNAELITDALRHLREVEPNRQVICLYEDLDALIEMFGENTLLSLLDGESNIDNVLNIASTNYPEKLDPRIVARPRRFDRLIKVGFPPREVREMYFKEKLGISDDELDMWVDASENFSFAAMTELVISVKCLDKNFDDVIEILKNLMTKKISSDQFEKKEFGFANKKNGKSGSTGVTGHNGKVSANEPEYTKSGSGSFKMEQTL